jgi:PAS domain-containing protein
MTAIQKIGNIDWVLASVALDVLLIVVCVVCILLIREVRKRQKLYRRFPGLSSEGLVVLSQKLDFLYCQPLFADDPLFDKLIQGSTFQEILDSKDWARMRQFFEETEKHRDMSFLFSMKLDEKEILWYELHCFTQHVSVAESQYVCFIKNITKEQRGLRERQELQSNLDLLLKTSGDLLWSMDIEKRQIKFLTPIIDDDMQYVPQSAGGIDKTSIMPEEDSAILDNLANWYISMYKTDKGIVNRAFPPVKIRLYGKDKSLLWYQVRGLLDYDESGSLVFQGVARRLDVMMDSFVFDSSQNQNALFSAALSLPNLSVFWVDRDYRILGANQGFANDFGIVDLEMIQGDVLNKVVNSKSQLYFNKVLSEVFASGHRVSWTSEGDKLDKPMLFNAVPLKVEAGIVIQAMCTYFRIDS